MNTRSHAESATRFLRVFWNRQLRLWTVTIEDEIGNQIGQAEYACSKAQMRALIVFLRTSEGNLAKTIRKD